jgi:hypothetical protein
MGENLAALREDRIAAAQFFEPVVEETLATGAGHLWHAASAQRHTTYTAFVTDPRSAAARLRSAAPHDRRDPPHAALDRRQSRSSDLCCNCILLSGDRPGVPGTRRSLSEGRSDSARGGVRPATPRAFLQRVYPPAHRLSGLRRQSPCTASRGRVRSKRVKTQPYCGCRPERCAFPNALSRQRSRAIDVAGSTNDCRHRIAERRAES